MGGERSGLSVLRESGHRACVERSLGGARSHGSEWDPRGSIREAGRRRPGQGSGGFDFREKPAKEAGKQTISKIKWAPRQSIVETMATSLQAGVGSTSEHQGRTGGLRPGKPGLGGGPIPSRFGAWGGVEGEDGLLAAQDFPLGSSPTPQPTKGTWLLR